MHTYISVIFRLTDRFRKRALLAPEVSFLLNKQRRRPLYKAGGYFIFTDLDPGEADFELGSPFFRTERLVADIPEANKGYLMIHLMLNPTRKYPFGGPVTTVFGRITRGGEAWAEQHFYLLPEDGGEVLKIAEDSAQAGNSCLKLFATVSGRQLSIPGNYLIKAKEEEKREFCFITEYAGQDGMYPLARGITFSHARGTPLVEAVECATSAEGGFFTALPDLKGEKARIDVLLRNSAGKSLKRTFEIEVKRENKLDLEL
ncbi:hypothetical protein REC12_24430 [Desulfosporosinus sp. PR]|uniref:hypothetical protein n=1 Tax=Candidatus Desulfosporosinus nitrosoreducens TaxID=3401928 RepID=UPI0027F8E265|nr:hypothetical protein [Desulfosporosinus sp. PR]MDQ7096744.1 hypothetical protein [Desulfosporosinus sp. PR]